jgi:hypothetical protein
MTLTSFTYDVASPHVCLSFQWLAPNNAPTWKQKNQDCLNKINNKPDGEFYNYWSYASSVLGPDTSVLSFKQDAASFAAQKGGQRFLSAAAKNWGRTALGSGSGFLGGRVAHPSFWSPIDA